MSLVKAVKRAGFTVKLYDDGSGLWGVWDVSGRATSQAFHTEADAYALCLEWMVAMELTPPNPDFISTLHKRKTRQA